MGVEHFDRDIAPQLFVAGAVNHSHAALADFLDDAIA
jgi:hypothetical protein